MINSNIVRRQIIIQSYLAAGEEIYYIVTYVNILQLLQNLPI